MKKLSTRKERIIWYSAIGAGVMVLLAVGLFWGILPAMDARRQLESSLVERRDQLKRARQELEYVPALVRSQEELHARIAAIRSQYLLRPTLGSYLVGVSERIDAEAQATGVKIEEIREIGMVNLPQKKKASNLESFKLYVVQVNGEGSYGAITRFLRVMEQANPFFMVTDLGITGQSDAPQAHRFTLRMEWPVEPASEKKEGGA